MKAPGTDERQSSDLPESMSGDPGRDEEAPVRVGTDPQSLPAEPGEADTIHLDEEKIKKAEREGKGY